MISHAYSSAIRSQHHVLDQVKLFDQLDVKSEETF
jgi:hypothetical protein